MANFVHTTRALLEQMLAPQTEATEKPVDRAHFCATHVEHATFGPGTCISEAHADPDAEGNIAWYTVQFADGTRKIDTADLKVTEGKSHSHSKKPMKEEEVAEANIKHPNQQKLDVHEPEKDELTAKDFEMLRKGKKVEKSVKNDDKDEMKEEIEQIDELSPSTLSSYKHKARNSELRSAETARRDTEISQQTTNPQVKAKSAAYAAQAQASAEKRRAGQLKATSRLSNMEEELEQTNEAQTSAAARLAKAKMKTSHQASTTMKHISNPTSGEKAAAKDIKPGIAGYRDRVAMLKSAEARGALKKEDFELIDVTTTYEMTEQVAIAANPTFQDYLNAVKILVNNDSDEAQREVIALAQEAFDAKEVDILIKAELQAMNEAGAIKMPTATGMKVMGSRYGNSAEAERNRTKKFVDTLSGPGKKAMDKMEKSAKAKK
jgi:hypothetical protein